MLPEYFKIFQDSKNSIPVAEFNKTTNLIIKKPINVFKDIFGRNTLTEMDFTKNVDEKILRNQDENGNIRGLKGVWEFNFEANYTMVGINFFTLKDLCFTPNIEFKKNGAVVNQRAKVGCAFDYFKETIRLVIQEDTDLLSMTLEPRILRTNISSLEWRETKEIMTTPVNLFHISFTGIKIADVE
jgi:hypothetical protein